MIECATPRRGSAVDAWLCAGQRALGCTPSPRTVRPLGITCFATVTAAMPRPSSRRCADAALCCPSRQGPLRAAGRRALPDRTAAPVRQRFTLHRNQESHMLQTATHASDATAAPTRFAFPSPTSCLCPHSHIADSASLVAKRERRCFGVSRGRGGAVVGRGLLAVPRRILLQRHRRDCPGPTCAKRQCGETLTSHGQRTASGSVSVYLALALALVFSLSATPLPSSLFPCSSLACRQSVLLRDGDVCFRMRIPPPQAKLHVLSQASAISSLCAPAWVVEQCGRLALGGASVMAQLAGLCMLDPGHWHATYRLGEQWQGRSVDHCVFATARLSGSRASPA